MKTDDLAYLRADRQRRVERGERILEHHGDRLAPYAPHFGRALLEQILARERDATVYDPAGRLGDQPDQRETGHRLPRSRLADERQRLAGMKREAHAIDRAGDAAAGKEMSPEILHHQQRWSGARHLAFTFTSS